MDTLRVDIRYRPLRIAWAIQAGDFSSFRKAVCYSYACWGGRFNPIIVVDREREATDIIEYFGVDFIVPVGNSEIVNNFPKKYPHLIHPFHGTPLFIKGDEHRRSYSQVLDIHNALTIYTDKPRWDDVRNEKPKIFSWNTEDPLSDVLLMQLGRYPTVEDVGTDYLELFRSSAGAIHQVIENKAEIPVEATYFFGIPWLSRIGISPIELGGHRPRHPGFFVGDASSFDDLVCFWNLRATDLSMWFIDQHHIKRYKQFIPIWTKLMLDNLSTYKHDFERMLGLWVRDTPENQSDGFKKIRQLFGDTRFTICTIHHQTWAGYGEAAPLMQLGATSTLAIKSGDIHSPRVTFPLTNKPFNDDHWFYSQHLVASISFLGGLYGEENNILHPPYVPEFNVFYARNMHFNFDVFRVERESIGLIVDACDTDDFVKALPVDAFIKRIFEFIGYDVEISSAGLIARQLITQIGGIRGSTVFKIPGIRRLLSTHGPGVAFTKNAAVCLIGSKIPDRPEVNFKNHEDLYIEPRPYGEKLTPSAAFAYMVDKGLYRLGADLLCPQCSMRSWTSIAVLDQIVTCEYCGHRHDVSRQLVDANEWHYRRSGVLGAEKNAQGAVPVLMTLEYMSDEFHVGFHDGFYSLSLNVSRKNVDVSENPFEVDFVWVNPNRQMEATSVIFGECKDHHSVEAADIENLKKLVTALPRQRFTSFVVLSKLVPFTEKEILLARTLNDEYHLRAILLTDKELELGHLESLKKRSETALVVGLSPQEMANKTAEIYFK